MLKLRTIGACTVGWLLITSALAGTVSHRAISGITTDVLGNLVEGVEILVLTEVTGMPPVALTRSDRNGRFEVSGLAPGVYRVAAVKEGYRTYLGRVNTLIGASLNVLLRPSSAGPVAEPPQDPSWALRIPRRSLLRETNQGPKTARRARAAGIRPARGPDFHEIVELQLDQLFHLGGRVPVGGGDARSLEGSETRVQLASVVGPNAKIELLGNRERLASASTRLSEEGSASRESSSVQFNFSYETSPDAKLAVRAFYAERDMEIAPARPISDDLDQGHKAWGYDAAWSKQLRPDSRLHLRFDYHDSSLEFPSFAAEGPPGSLTDHDGDGWLSTVRAGARGTFETVPAERHQVRVGFDAQFVEVPPSSLRAVPQGSGFGAPGVAGWSLGLNAEDSWSVAAPLTLVYGLGYRHAMEGSDASLIVPRFGGVWSEDWVSVRLLLSYHAVANSGEPPIERDEASVFRLDRRLGYDAEVEIPLLESLRLTGAVSHSPIQFQPLLPDPTTGAIPYLTDGNTASTTASLGLAHESRRATTRLTLSRGVADGMLAALRSFTTPVQVLSENRLDYSNGSLGVRVVPSGTDLTVEYLRVEESPESAYRMDRALVEESLEFRLMQDLLRMEESSASWKLLLALRLASIGSEPTDGGGAPPIEVPVESANQLSAGVSVTF